jgi:hypothetical protein
MTQVTITYQYTASGRAGTRLVSYTYSQACSRR